MRIVAVLLIVLISSVSHSQQVLSPLATKVIISKQDCQRAIQHIPSPDVAYKAGVDVHGKPVVPADLPSNGNGIKLPDQIEFKYSINPTNFGLTAAQASSQSQLVTGNNSQLPVATIKYDLASGLLTVNGKPLAGNDQQGIAEECRKIVVN